jgi:membrane protease YdiL (CAAX protease family)
MNPTSLKTIAGFVLLFAGYHAAEYMMLFRKSPAGFLLLTGLFFLAGFLIARWQGDKSLHRWGLSTQRGFPAFLITGLLAGLTINMLMTLTCHALDIEFISFVPPLRQFLPQAALLLFGCGLSSLSEDVLTRCYVFRHTDKKWNPVTIVLFSSLVYALNHIYRLQQPVSFLYLFMLGIQLAVPLLVTRNIWYTLGVHWAGNIVYHLTNSIMHTSAGSNPFPSMVVALIFTVLSIPVHYLICRQLTGNRQKETAFALQRHSSPHIRHSSGLV